MTPASLVLLDPIDRVQLRVTATFSDGGRRDVTALAVFDPSNLGAQVNRDGVVTRQPTRRNHHPGALPRPPGDCRSWRSCRRGPDLSGRTCLKLTSSTITSSPSSKTLRTLPSDRCIDSVFLRRALPRRYRHCCPRPTRRGSFLADTRPDKRARLIDRSAGAAGVRRLLGSEMVGPAAQRGEGARQKGRAGRSSSGFARASPTASRSTNSPANWSQPAAAPTTSRPPTTTAPCASRNTRAEAVAQVFLGIRMQCAKCHNHPFEHWTQNDYHSFAAFFSRVEYRIVENNRKDKLDKHEFDGEQIVFFDREGETACTRAPARSCGRSSSAPRLRSSPATPTVYVCSPTGWPQPDNPFFARAQVNRVWYHLLGPRHRRAERRLPRHRIRPCNGPLLDALAHDFAGHHFDLRHLVRIDHEFADVSAFRAAQRDEPRRRDELFARPTSGRLQAEVLARRGVPGGRRAARSSTASRGARKAVQLPGVGAARAQAQRATDAEQFLTAFGKPMRLLTCECERSEETTLNQAFQLITGEMLNQMLTEPDNRIGQSTGRRQTAGRRSWTNCTSTALSPAADDCREWTPRWRWSRRRRTGVRAWKTWCGDW